MMAPLAHHQGRSSLWLWDTEILADFFRGYIVDLVVTWDRGFPIVCGIAVLRVAAALTNKLTSMALKMANEISAFHLARDNQLFAKSIARVCRPLDAVAILILKDH